jgi:3',5'-cyclic AMP phosphodiesterase CpdA
MKIIHLSDLHLPEPGQSLWGLDAYGRVKKALDDIQRFHSDAAFLVISGDLTDRGASGAYEWLAEQVSKMTLETVFMVGNHDARAPFRAGLPDVMDDGNGFIQGKRETGHGTFLFLDTYKDGTSPGQYCAQRQDWLSAALADARGPVRIFMHHPPFDIGVPYMDRIKLEDAEAFATLLDGHDICHLFFGHVHRACFLSWRGIPCNALPGTNHQVPLVAGSTEARYSVEPPMYGVILIDGAQTIVHLDAYMDRGSADVPD